MTARIVIRKPRNIMVVDAQGYRHIKRTKFYSLKFPRFLERTTINFQKSLGILLIVLMSLIAIRTAFGQETTLSHPVRGLGNDASVSALSTSETTGADADGKVLFNALRMPEEVVLSVSEIYCKLRPTYNRDAIEELLSNLARFSDTYTDDLPGLMERKTIRVLITTSLTNFFVSSGRIYGFEYSLLKEYESFINRHNTRHDLKTVVEFIPVPEELLVPSLEKGLGDIVAAGLIVTDGKHPGFEFSAPYLTDVSEVLVSSRDVDPIRSLRDVAGKQIYVRPISSYYESLGRLNAQLNSMGLAPVRIIKADDNVTSEDILEMLNAGIIELSIIESHLAELWSDILPNLKLHDQLPLRQGANLAWMVRKNNPLLKDSLDEFVKDHKKGTLLGNIYFNRYFKDTKWISNPLDTNARDNSFRYAPLFKKYGAEYNIDWMLLSALGYQESRLEHNRRSPKGAVGIMQIMPSTAMDPRINIVEFHQIENNIQAGAKYLALLRDTYFNDSGMEPIDRLRYALAAYNAGPANIQRARDLAAEMGYDPNRWFLHGEIGALKLIGQETVRYVSNINKFYLAYSLADTLDCLKAKNSETIGRRHANDEAKIKKERMKVQRH